MLSNNTSGTWSGQHKDLFPANQQNDEDDLNRVLEFLQANNPFEVQRILQNIAFGVIADERVNVDDSLVIGMRKHRTAW